MGQRLAGHDRPRVGVGEVRRQQACRSLVEAGARVEPGRRERGLLAVSLEARPAQVGDGRAGRVGDPVDLLVVVPADVAEPHFVGRWPDRESEWVACPEADDPAGVGIGAAGHRVGRQAGAGRRVDAEDRSVEDDRVAGRPAQALAPERAAPGGRRGLGAARTGRRVAARVLDGDPVGPAELAVIDVGEARAVAAGDVQGAICAEPQVADGVAGELLAPVLDQDVLGAGPDVARRGQSREASADDAAVGGRTRRRWTRVIPARHRPAVDAVERVEHVDIRVRREVRVERHAQQAPIPVVVDPAAQVGEDGRCRAGQAGEDFDQAGFLRHEHPTIR